MISNRNRQLHQMLLDKIKDAHEKIVAAKAALRTERPREVDIEEEAFLNEDTHVRALVAQLCTENGRSFREALTRLDAGTYGICAGCKEEIPEPRLKALPFADKCLECQQAIEDEGSLTSMRERTLGAERLGKLSVAVPI